MAFRHTSELSIKTINKRFPPLSDYAMRTAYGMNAALTFTLSETKTPAFPITMGSAEAFFCYALSL